MRVLLFVSMTMLSLGLHADCVDAEIYAAMDAVVANLPKEGRKSWPEYIISFGYPYQDNAAYLGLAEVVSNNFDYVYANFPCLATNDIQRLVLLSSGWAYDEDYYILSYSKVLDLARDGQVSKREFRWFECAGRPHRTSVILARRYKDPKVREIVCRYQEFSGDTNRCEYILSGKAKRDAMLAGRQLLVPIWDYPIVRIALAVGGALIVVIIALIWYLKKRLRGSGRKEMVVVIFCMVSFVALGQEKLSEDEMYVELKQATLFEHGDDRALAVEAIRKHSGKTREEWAKILIETSANWQNGFLMYDVRFYATKDNLPRLGEIINDTSKKNLVRMNAFTVYAMVDDYGEDSARVIRELRRKNKKDRVLNSCRSIIFYSFEENDCRRIRMEEALGFSKE